MNDYCKRTASVPWIHPRAIKILRIGVDFDRRLGSPSNGYSPRNRDFYMARVNSCLRLALSTCAQGEATDVPLDDVAAALPYVPSWNIHTINWLKQEESTDPFVGICNKLQEENEFSERLAEQIAKESNRLSEGYNRMPSGRYTV